MSLNSYQQVLFDLSENIKLIPERRNYWLIRTQGGNFYDTFLKNSFIAVGYNKITTTAIFEYARKAVNAEKPNNIQRSVALYVEKFHEGKIEEYIDALNTFGRKKKYGEFLYHTREITQTIINRLAVRLLEENERSRFLATALFRFMFEIKAGDVVIVPSTNSDEISFGYIGKDYGELDPDQARRLDCSYYKTRSIRWINEVKRHQLDPLLYRVLQAHQAVNNINKYSSIIERSIGNLYSIGDSTNVVFRIEKEGAVSAEALFAFGNRILSDTRAVLKELGVDSSLDGIEIKINVNSPGPGQFISDKAYKALIIGVVGVFLVGGGITYESNSDGSIKSDAKSDGLIKAVSGFLRDRHEETMNDKERNQLDSLKIVPPTDTVDVIGKGIPKP